MLPDGVTIVQLTKAARYLFVAAFLALWSLPAVSQSLRENPIQPDAPDDEDRYMREMDDLIHTRLQRERAMWGTNKQLVPEILRLEANYIRTNLEGEQILHEGSFHLEPRYFSYSPEGRETNSPYEQQSIMYFVGSARTPLALPVVSDLSKVLSGDEASYTVYLGILPLPRPVDATDDSVRYYCIIERAIESNRSEAEKKFERYAKEFTAKQGEPIQLRLENTPPERQTYIVKIEDNQTLNFYEDFARHFREHILLSGERLQFGLGKADVSVVSSRLTFPYTVGASSHVKVELVSVVDEAHPLVLVDSIMRPAEYLATHDMKPYANGTYRYRITAKEIGSGKVLYNEIKSFEKKQPVLVGQGIDLASADTLEVGGKRVSAQQKLLELNQALMVEKVKNERLDASLAMAEAEKESLKKVVDASQSNVIAGLRGRAGIGLFGNSTGYNLFVGAESAVPALTLDISYGLLYASTAPYLSYEEPANFSQIFSSPKSLGLQIGWAPVAIIEGVVSPVVRLGYYGIYSQETPATKGGRHSATLLVPMIGITSTPGGKGTNFGADLTLGPAFGLGIAAPAKWDMQVKIYIRY